MKLVLFDIDGTVLWTRGAGRRAMEYALQKSFGVKGPPSYRYDGKTDIQIVRESMREMGIEEASIDARIPVVFELYLAQLAVELEKAPETVERFVGVLELLDALEARSDRVVGLLTGNVLDGAVRKLRAGGVDPARFQIGAFGSDHEHRHALPAIAVERAAAVLGLTFAGHQVVIIGDTPADIHCGRPIGARAIAVATGHFSEAELWSHEPAAVFTDLSDTDAVMRAIDHA